MIINQLKTIYEQNHNKNPLYIRSVLKGNLHYYILNFVYNSKYADSFLFKGGTALRFCFGLPRLSEDVDFDVKNFNQFNFGTFISDLQTFFADKYQYKELNVKKSGANNIIYLQFPILEKVGYPINLNKPTENILHVRIDIAPVIGKSYSEEISLKSTFDFSFLIKRYALDDLYAGKINAILTRERWQGNIKEPRFKGRDYFDIWWLKEKQSSINFPYLQSLINIRDKKTIIRLVNEKIQEAVKRKNDLKDDLLPFFEDTGFVDKFVENLSRLTITIS